MTDTIRIVKGDTAYEFRNGGDKENVTICIFEKDSNAVTQLRTYNREEDQLHCRTFFTLEPVKSESEMFAKNIGQTAWSRIRLWKLVLI